MTTPDPAAWLAAQLDDVERLAPAVHHEGCDSVVRTLRDGVVWPLGPCNCGLPAAVLRDIAAKRRILAMWADPADVGTLPDGVADGRDPDERDAQVAAAEAIDDVVRLLAEAYDQRPGYREEWRP